MHYRWRDVGGKYRRRSGSDLVSSSDPRSAELGLERGESVPRRREEFEKYIESAKRYDANDVLVAILILENGGDPTPLSLELERSNQNKEKIEVKGIKVEGLLDFEAHTLSKPLYFRHCIFDDVNFKDARCRLLDFELCHISKLHLRRIQIEQSLFLKGTRVERGVDLRRARIGIQIDFEAASFSFDEPGDPALNCDGIQIGDAATLSGSYDAPFEVEGCVDFNGATIGNRLDLRGAKINAGNDIAINCGGARIAGSVWLHPDVGNHHSDIKGLIRFVGAHIGGRLACRAMTVVGGSEGAMDFRRATISRDVYLAESNKVSPGESVGTEIQGTVSFVSATINGAFICNRLGLRMNPEENPDDEVKNRILRLYACTIEQRLTLRKFEYLEGDIDLTHAEAATLNDDDSYWRTKPENAKPYCRDGEVVLSPRVSGCLLLDGFVYKRISNLQTMKERKYWLDCQCRDTKNNEFIPQPYTQLARVLRDEGHEKEARDVSIARERRRFYGITKPWLRLVGILVLFLIGLTAFCVNSGTAMLFALGGLFFLGLSSRYLRNFASNVLIAHGYSPWRGVAISVLLICSCACIFAYAHKQGSIVPAQEEVLLHHQDGGTGPKDYPPFHPLIFSIDLFVPLGDMHQVSYWIVKGPGELTNHEHSKPATGPRWALPDDVWLKIEERLPYTEPVRQWVSGINRSRVALGEFVPRVTLFQLLMWVEISLGWMLSALVGIAFSGVLRRE